MGFLQYPSRNFAKLNTFADEKNVVKCEKKNRRRGFKSFSVFKRTFYLFVQMSAYHKPTTCCSMSSVVLPKVIMMLIYVRL